MDDQVILNLFANEKTRASAFAQLVDKYQQPLYWRVRRMLGNHEDANDVVQNIFIKVWKALANFRGDSKLYTWLYTIAGNEAITFIKQKKRQPVLANEQQEEQGTLFEIKADSYFDESETERKLKEAIESLPEKQKQVFEMRYYDEIKYEKMSEILGTSVGALKASYHHAVKKIEAFILQ